MCVRSILFCVLGIFAAVNESEASWDEWWTYDGISGSSFWGLINPQWSLCSKGRRQSPINIEPDKLLFDPHLRPVHVDKHKIQVYGFNAELYHNMSEAQHKSQGLVAISLMVQLGDTPNPELRIITSAFNKVLYRGDKAQVRHLSLQALLPDTNGYMTYEGSTTYPGCWETAVWLILNKPIYITAQELYVLRRVMQGPDGTPKAPLANNARPLQGLHHRTIRTNIDFRKRPDAKCPSMAQDMRYRDDFFFPANTWRDDGSLSHNVV
ncbi:putative carbonic anhydrase-like protein 2 isoform X5 [Cephus cinctus]|uniref:Carbonic anhydrase-like protein 2 isoform X5 n=1 Tax=Cephus cinctus TaxID=211228 RepID=A0AAJ7RTQ3_CEPCN|nr:putative carbonic anhydrase-like protein 2 isoform X5 [Cephus cinctus]